MKTTTICVVVLSLLSAAPVLARSPIQGKLFGVFQDKGGNSLQRLELDADPVWRRVSPPIEGLSDVVVLGDSEFLGLAMSRLLRFSANGQSETLLEGVQSFCYNRNQQTVIAVVKEPSGAHSLRALNWPGGTSRRIDGHPPVGRYSKVSSQGDKVVVESLDQRIYLADLPHYAFTVAAEGAEPVLSRSGRFLAFLDQRSRNLRILDTQTKRLKRLKTGRVGVMTWISDHQVSYSYSWKTLFMIEAVMRVAVIDVMTGQTQRLPLDDGAPRALSWTD